MKALLQTLMTASSRLAGTVLAQASKAALNLQSSATEKEVEAWADDVNIFFILAIGRSGSMFLAHLLNRAPGACVYHEPVLADFAAYTQAFYDEDSAKDYVHSFRKREIYVRVRARQLDTYGEVNSNLRRHAKALRREFPNTTLVHLVRDGRDAVRSMMSRRTYRFWDPVTSGLQPAEGDPQRDAWPEMNRFEKLCWYWSVENRYLRHAIHKTVRLEDLTSDYSYFRQKLLKPLQLAIPESTWLEATETPKNVTTRYQIPHWSRWDAEMQQAFEKICGEEMVKNGYSLRWHGADTA